MKEAIGIHRVGLVVAGLGLVIAVPLVIGLVAMRRSPWVPVVDFALTELRVRDTFSGNPPLLGLPGRIGTLERQGSHPGPMSFYLMTPVYRLLGSTAWGMQAATVGVHLIAVGTALWIGLRRGGLALAAGVAAVLAVLSLGFGVRALAEPWNPYLPVLMWVLFLLAVWSVVVGDVPMLPIAAAAGTFCAQTHISYLALFIVLGTMAFGAGIWWARARARDGTRSGPRRWAWVAVAAGVIVVLWLPPLVQQLRGDPGNVTILLDYFGAPPEPPIGLGPALSSLVGHLDVRYLVLGQLVTPGELTNGFAPGSNRAVGAGVLLVWLAAAAAAVWLRHRSLVGLHAVIGVALAVGIVSVSRIFGVPWYYLTLWLWGIAGLMLFAIGWSFVEVARRRLPDVDRRHRLALVGVCFLVGFAVVVSGRLSVAGTSVERPDAIPSRVITELVPDVVSAITDGSGDATGRDGRYLVTWSDSQNLGENGFGLFGELERQGFDVGVSSPYSTQFGEHRVVDVDDATAQIALATGVNVEEWRAVPGAVEVAFVEPRTSDEQAEFERIRSTVIDSLRDDGLVELVPEVDRNLFAVGLDPRLSEHTQSLVARLGQFGLPTAVFVAPPDAAAG